MFAVSKLKQFILILAIIIKCQDLFFSSTNLLAGFHLFDDNWLAGNCDLTFIISWLTFRRWMLERKLKDAEVPVEEQNNILKHLEKKETEYMRLQRHKMGVEDFELLTIIGRGAFGEVQFISVSIL